MRTALSLLAVLLLAVLLQPVQAVTIETVPVGNPGNAAQANGFGSVGYEYRIGKYEVTNDQYVEFLNAKAAGTDPLGLYEPMFMGGTGFRGGIDRIGAFGFYSYASKPNMGNKPVNHTTWYDAIRFINWLHNGQGNGNTEAGAYTLEGGTPTPSNGPNVVRDPDAIWFMPNQDEWFKAAHYQPTAQGGDADGYWLYTTRSNTTPTVATATSTGDISNPGANVANFSFSADWNGVDGNVTTIGSAGPLTATFYGTFDQGGNVREWNETPYMSGASRGSRGGSYISSSGDLSYNVHSTTGAQFEGGGFRVATLADACPLSGDFNCNSIVDAADYVVWRKNDGTPAGYAAWRANFGMSVPGGGSQSSVPEPSAVLSLCCAVIAVSWMRFARPVTSPHVR